jgi:hypothetical protein
MKSLSILSNVLELLERENITGVKQIPINGILLVWLHHTAFTSLVASNNLGMTPNDNLLHALAVWLSETTQGRVNIESPHLILVKMAPRFENPKTTHYEFMGVPGTCRASKATIVTDLTPSCASGSLLMPIGLPFMTYALYYWCNSQDGTCNITSIPALPALKDLYTHEAFFVILAWFLFQAILYIALPGPVRRLVTLQAACIRCVHGVLIAAWA